MTLLELGHNLLCRLKINRIFVFPDHFELRYQNEGKLVIAYGKTESETIENFYELYKQAFSGKTF